MELNITEEHIHEARQKGACGDSLDRLTAGLSLAVLPFEDLAWAQDVGMNPGCEPLQFLSRSGDGSGSGYGSGYGSGSGYGDSYGGSE